MARITLDHLAHAYKANPRTAEDYALKEINHVWSQGGAYALLGPSGCGKTTLLNIISGLVRPTRGRVLFDDLDVTDLSTEARNIAQVFQDRKSTRLNSSHANMSYAVFCLKKKKT